LRFILVDEVIIDSLFCVSMDGCAVSNYRSSSFCFTLLNLEPIGYPSPVTLCFKVSQIFLK